LLRLFDALDPNYRQVFEALRLIRRLGHQPVISVQNAVEFWNVMTRPATARGGFGASLRMTQRRLQHIERWCKILPESLPVFAEWKKLVAAFGVSGRAVHDARLVAQMVVSRIPNLLTLNPNDFRRYPRISVSTPTEFIAAHMAP